MDINDLTIGQIKEINAMMAGSQNDAPTTSKHVGKKCIIRTYASGVHFGQLTACSGRAVELSNARRLWRWDAADKGISLSEIANHGPTGSRSRICETVSEMTILDALEIIPAKPAAVIVIESAEVAKSNG